MEARATFREAVTVSVFYVLVFALLVHPMAARFPSVITVDGPDAAYLGDGAMFVWNVDHFAHAVHAGQNPFHANDILVPIGADLWLHTYVPIVGMIAVVVGSPIVALAIAIGASFVLSGLGAYLLARRFLAHPVLALLAGMVFAFCPYKLARLLGHYNLELTATLPFFALLLLDWHLENPPRERGVLASPGFRGLAAVGLLSITLASDFYATYFCLWMVASTVGLRFLEVHPVRTSRKKLLLVSAVLLGASTGLVELYFALGGQAHGAFGYSADLVGYLLPSASHRWLGGPGLLALKEKLRNGTIEHEVYAGITIVVLVAWLLVARALRTKSPNERWLAFFTGTFLLLASPVIRIGGIRVLGLPHAVLNMLPGIGNLRVPARFSVVMMLGAGILAMLAVERLIFPRVGRAGRGLVASFARRAPALRVRPQAARRVVVGRRAAHLPHAGRATAGERPRAALRCAGRVREPRSRAHERDALRHRAPPPADRGDDRASAAVDLRFLRARSPARSAPRRADQRQAPEPRPGRARPRRRARSAIRRASPRSRSAREDGRGHLRRARRGARGPGALDPARVAMITPASGRRRSRSASSPGP